MTPETAFLNAIHADPGDRMTYAVFADWLEEHGDPRAELVRALLDLRGLRDAVLGERICAAEQLYAGPAGKRLRRLGEVGDVSPDPRGLLRLHLRALPRDPAAFRDVWDWVTEVVVSRQNVLRQVPELLERLPLLSRLTLRPAPGQLAAWTQEAGRVRCRPVAVRVELEADPRALSHLDDLVSVLFGGLRELSLRRCQLGDSARMVQLLTQSGLKDLRRLELDYNRIAGYTLRALVRSLAMDRLEVLSLNGNSIGDEGLGALLGTTSLPALAELHLDGTWLTLGGLGTWLRSRCAPPADRPFHYRSVPFDFGWTVPPEGPAVVVAWHDRSPWGAGNVENLPFPAWTDALTFRRERPWERGDLARILVQPQLSRLRRLCLCGGLSVSLLEVLAWILRYSSIEILELTDDGLTEDVLRPLVVALLPRYPTLRLRSRQLGPESPVVAALRERFPRVEVGNEP
jgi:uncharacterized protein (TIGR02996 family)